MWTCFTCGKTSLLVVTFYTTLAFIKCNNVKRSAYFVKQGAFVNNDEIIQCAAISVNADRIGIRTDTTSGNCLPVHVSEYRDNGAEEGFSYFLKSLGMQWWNPGNTYMETAISGIPTLGSYFEFQIRVDGRREFIIDLIDSVAGDRPFHCRARSAKLVLNSNVLPGGFGAEEWPATPFTEDRVYTMRHIKDLDIIQAIKYNRPDGKIRIKIPHHILNR